MTESGHGFGMNSAEPCLQESVATESGAECRKLIVGERIQGESDFAAVASDKSHGGLNGNGVGGQSQHIAAEWEEFVVPMLSGGDIAGFEGVEHRFDISGYDISGDGNDAGGTESEQWQSQTVVTGEHGEF